MVPSWLIWSISLARAVYDGIRLWLDYKREVSPDDVKACAIKIEQARKDGDNKRVEELTKQLERDCKC